MVMQADRACRGLIGSQEREARMLLSFGGQLHSARAEAFSVLCDILFPLLPVLIQQLGVEKLAADFDRMRRAVGE